VASGVGSAEPAWGEGPFTCDVVVQRKCSSLGPKYRVETCGAPASPPTLYADGHNRTIRFYTCTGAPRQETLQPWGMATGAWGGASEAGWYGRGGEGYREEDAEWLETEAAAAAERLASRGSVLNSLWEKGGAAGVMRRVEGGGKSSSSSQPRPRRGVWDEAPIHFLPHKNLPGGPGFGPEQQQAPLPAPSGCTDSSAAPKGALVCLESTPLIPPTGRAPVHVVLAGKGTPASSSAAGSRCTCFLRHDIDSYGGGGTAERMPY